MKRIIILSVITLERVAKFFLDLPEQLERWKQLTEEHITFKNLCQKYHMYPNFESEHLRNR